MSRPASVFPFCLSPEHAAFLQRYRSVLWLRWHPVASIKRCGDPKHLASSLHVLSRLSHRRVVSEADGDHVAVVSVHAREWFLCSNLARENSPGFYYNGLSAVYVTAPKDKLVDQRPDAERQCISKDPTAYLENYTAAEVTKKKKMVAVQRLGFSKYEYEACRWWQQKRMHLFSASSVRVCGTKYRKVQLQIVSFRSSNSFLMVKSVVLSGSF